MTIKNCVISRYGRSCINREYIIIDNPIQSLYNYFTTYLFLKITLMVATDIIEKIPDINESIIIE